MNRSEDDLEKGEEARTEPEKTLSGSYLYEDEEEVEVSLEQSVFQQWWFRALLAGIALLVVAVIALPYLMDRRSPAPTRSVAMVEDRAQSEPRSARPEPRGPQAPSALRESGATKPSDTPTTPQAEKLHPPAVAPPPGKPEARPAPPALPTIPKIRQAAVGASPKAPAAPAPAKEAPTRKGLAPTNSKGEYWVQVGAFKSSKYATRLAARINDEQYPVEVHRRASTATPLIVRVGSYPGRQQAEAVRADLERKGFPGFVLEAQGR